MTILEYARHLTVDRPRPNRQCGARRIRSSSVGSGTARESARPHHLNGAKHPRSRLAVRCRRLDTRLARTLAAEENACSSSIFSQSAAGTTRSSSSCRRSRRARNSRQHSTGGAGHVSHAGARTEQVVRCSSRRRTGRRRPLHSSARCSSRGRRAGRWTTQDSTRPNSTVRSPSRARHRVKRIKSRRGKRYSDSLPMRCPSHGSSTHAGCKASRHD